MGEQVKAMHPRFIFLGLIWGIWGIVAGCNQPDETENQPTDDADTFTDDAAIDTFDDTGSASEHDTAPDVLLGTDPPRFSYEGYEEQYILTDDDDPEDVCRVRYELHAVAKPSVPCTICRWEAVVEKSNPTITVDLDNACENSELGLDASALSAGVGERVAYGFAEEAVGHANILMRYNPKSGRWEEFTVSNWDESISELRYKRRDGMCAYTAEGDTDLSTQGICGISGLAVVTELTGSGER